MERSRTGWREALGSSIPGGFGGRAVEDAAHQAGGGRAGYEWKRHYAPSARLYDLASDDLLNRPVAALDQYIRLDRRNHLAGIRRIKDRHIVHTRERGQHFGPLPLRHQRPFRPLERGHRRIAVDRHDQEIPERAGFLEVPGVANVKEVKTAVGKHNTTTVSPGNRSELGEFRNCLEFGRHQQESLNQKYNRFFGRVARFGRDGASPVGVLTIPPPRLSRSSDCGSLRSPGPAGRIRRP